MAIDATVKGTSSNSYQTRATADSYLKNERLFISAWTDAAGSSKDAALIWATFILEIAIDYDGTPTTATQKLRLPRSGLVDADGDTIDMDTIPVLAEKASAELALYLLQRDRTAESELIGKAIKKAKVGPLEVEVDKTEEIVQLIPSYILTILEPIGSLKESADRGDKVVRLNRS
jgi:hypothetical protein